MDIDPNDLVEIVFVEIWKRILTPELCPDVGAPDPGVNFAGCIETLTDRAEAALYSLPRCERQAYILERARESLRWCKKSHAPDLLTERVNRWLLRLQPAPA